MRSAALACLLWVCALPALAGQKPLYKPAPAWVLPAPDPASAKPGGAPLVIFDEQQRLANGEVWSYLDTARRITSEQALTQAGTVSLQWQPDEGDLIVHRIEILRAGQRINLLTGAEPLTILRRERGLESLMLDGVLTATMPVQGLQVGDTLRVTYSTTHSDPALKGAMQSLAILLPDQTQVDFARARVLWPSSQQLRWKALSKATIVNLSTAGGDRQLTVTMPLPKQPEVPPDAPARFHPLPILELSTFRDWPDVSRTMAPLFKPVPPAPGTPLAVEIARVAATSPDPKTRAARALQSVQGNVRYLFNGLDHGNYVPQPPEKTWSVRYGDCKAKTLLLLTMLEGLGISAEPVLANLQYGDFLPDRLPTAGAFNHILVTATIGGQLYWLDGTGGGARLADLGDTPNLRHVLPLRADGADLMTVRTHANARAATAIAIDMDQTAGVDIPSPVKLELTIAGPVVEALKAANAQLSGEKRKQLLDRFVTGAGQNMLIVTRELAFDDQAGTATLHYTGLAGGGWTRQDQRYSQALDATVARLNFGGDRARPEWRAIPVATPGVESRVIRATIRLPNGGHGFAIEGDTTLPPKLAGISVHRTASLDGGIARFEDRLDATAEEIAPADIADARAKLALAKSRLLKVTAPRDYPRHWIVVREAQKAGKLKPIEAAYTAAIADATEKAPAFFNRANFRESIYDRRGALADMDQVIAARPTVQALLRRANLNFALHQEAKALADARAAYALDPGAPEALGGLAQMLDRTGDHAHAMAMLDEAIGAGGERRPQLLAAKADLLARAHKPDDAIAAIDAAIAAKPGDATLLNNRCWIKGTLGVALPTALKDCTKAIELGDESFQALDSRAMVYFKMNRMDDALADLNAALDQQPELAQSLYMRGVIERRQNARGPSEEDLTGARLSVPRIDEDYALWGVAAS